MGKDLSENEQLLENLTKRFQGNERRTERDTQKGQCDIKNVKKKAQEIRKDFERQENVRGKMKATMGIKKQSRRCSSEVVGFLQEKFK